MVSAAGDGGAKSPNHWSRPMFFDTFPRPKITSSRKINLDYPFKREKVAKTAIFRDVKRRRTFKIPKGKLEVSTCGNLARLTGIRRDENR